jgi:hypothetical protein
MLHLPLLLQLHGLATAGEDSLAAFGDNHLRAALSTLIALARLIGHFPSPSITSQPQSSASYNAGQCSVRVGSGPSQPCERGYPRRV